MATAVVPTPAPTGEGPFAGRDISVLPPRLREVAQLRLEGLGTKAIAEELELGWATVLIYLRRIRRALGLPTLVRKAPPRAPIAPLAANDVQIDMDEDAPVPGIQQARARAVVGADGRVRAKTIPGYHLTRAEQRLPSLAIYPEDVERPQTRGDCANMPRPCPFVSCAHHLYLDVNPDSGAIKLNFPHLEVWEMAETCSLDVADRDGVTLEEVGNILNLTRERVRQLEQRGVHKVRQQGGKALGIR